MVLIEIYDVNHASILTTCAPSWISFSSFPFKRYNWKSCDLHGHTSETVVMIIDDFLTKNPLLPAAYSSEMSYLRQMAVDHPNCYWEVEYLDSPEIDRKEEDYSSYSSFDGIQPTSFSDFVKYPAVLTIQRCFRGFMGRRIAREKRFQPGNIGYRRAKEDFEQNATIAY